MEQVFFRLHVRSVSLFSGLFHTKSREFFEKMLLLSACLFLALLVGLHANFVNLNQENNCLRYLVNKDNVSLQDFDIIRIYVSNEKLQDNLLNLFQSKTGRNATGFIIPYNQENKVNDIDSILCYSVEDNILENQSVATEKTLGKEECFENTLTSTDVSTAYQCSPANPSVSLEDENTSANTSKYPTLLLSSLSYLRNAISRTWLSSSVFRDYLRMERLYIFSLEKAFLLLPHSLRQKHNISQASITVSKHSSCFGNTGTTGVGGGAGLAWMVHNIIGYDTIVMNWLITEFEGKGFLYNTNSREMYNLNLSTDFKRDRQGWSHIIFYKVGILFTTLFLFFTTTTLVSFTLRETQERMLKFTHLLQHYVRHRLPYAPLVLTHVVESLVFVPIMIGILFFLFEFFSDQLLAFLVMSLVWMAEVFSVVSVRTQPSIRFFPRAFFLYFSLFHIYFFSFPFGYSYIALLTTTLFLQHSMMYCWNHFEVVALHEGVVSATRPREVAGLLGWMQQSDGDRDGGGGLTSSFQAEGGYGGHSLALPQYGAESTVTAGRRRERRNSEPDSPSSSSFGQFHHHHRLLSQSLQQQQQQQQPLLGGNRSRRDSDPSPSSNNRFQYNRQQQPLLHQPVASSLTSTVVSSTAAAAASTTTRVPIPPPSPPLLSNTTASTTMTTMSTGDHVELSRRIQQHQITELINYNANINAAETLRSQDTTSSAMSHNSNSTNNSITGNTLPRRLRSTVTTSDRNNDTATTTHNLTSSATGNTGTSSSHSNTGSHFSPTRNITSKMDSERASPPRPGVSSYLWSTFWSQSTSTTGTVTGSSSSSSGNNASHLTVGLAGGSLSHSTTTSPTPLTTSSVFSPGRLSTSQTAGGGVGTLPRLSPPVTTANYHRGHRTTGTTTTTANSVTSPHHGGYNNNNSNTQYEYHHHHHHPSSSTGSTGSGSRTLSYPFPEVETQGGEEEEVDIANGDDSEGSRDGSRSKREREGKSSSSSRNSSHMSSPLIRMNATTTIARRTPPTSPPSPSPSPPSRPSSGNYEYGYNTSSFTVFGTDLYDNNTLSTDNNINDHQNIGTTTRRNSHNSHSNSSSTPPDLPPPPTYDFIPPPSLTAYDRMNVTSNEGNETHDEQIGLSEIFM